MAGAARGGRCAGGLRGFLLLLLGIRLLLPGISLGVADAAASADTPAIAPEASSAAPDHPKLANLPSRDREAEKPPAQGAWRRQPEGETSKNVPKSSLQIGSPKDDERNREVSEPVRRNQQLRHPWGEQQKQQQLGKKGSQHSQLR